MNTVLIAKFIFFVLAIIGYRLVLRQAGRQLTDEQREQIDEASQTVILLRSVFIFGPLIINLLLLSQPKEVRETFEAPVAIAAAFAIVVLAVINFFQIRRLDLPKSITNKYLLSVSILLLGVVVLFVPF